MTDVVREEKKHLRRDLSLFDMIFYSIAGALGIDTLGAVSSYGGQALFWMVLTALIIFLPYGVSMAELGSTFPQEGGVYEWSQRAGGRFYAALTNMFYWISNPLWIGGTMFVTVVAAVKIFWFGNASILLGGNKVSDTLITIGIALLFIWGIMLSALLPLRISKWFSTIGGVFKLVLIALFVALAIAFFMGGHATGEHLHGGDFLPSGDWGLILSGILPLMFFKWTGFEVMSGPAEEIQDPQRDVPRSLLLSGGIAVLAYALPIAVILLALSKSQIANANGLLQAISTITLALPPVMAMLLKWLLVPIVVIALGAAGATWMGSANRTYAIAALDHTAPRALGHFSPKSGAPVAAIMTSGVIATIAMLGAALVTAFGSGTILSLFNLVLGFTISINALAYLLIFPTLLILRYKFPDVKRPYRVPGGKPGVWIVTIITTIAAAIGSYFMLIPTDGVIDGSGVSRMTYEVTQFVALGAIVLLAIIFYFWGEYERKHEDILTTESDDVTAFSSETEDVPTLVHSK